MSKNPEQDKSANPPDKGQETPPDGNQVKTNKRDKQPGNADNIQNPDKTQPVVHHKRFEDKSRMPVRSPELDDFELDGE
jgi:hypothetical protein